MWCSLLNLFITPALNGLDDGCVVDLLALGGSAGLGTNGCCGDGKAGMDLTGDGIDFGGRDGGGGDGCRGFYSDKNTSVTTIIHSIGSS